MRNYQYKIIYDKVLKELKQKFIIKHKFKKVMNQLTNLQWIKVDNEKEYDNKVLIFFNETDQILQNKINKYQNIIHKLKQKKRHNNIIKQNAINKTLFTKPCPICYEHNFNSYAITRCGHTFCTNCIKKSICIQFKCPLCRGILFFKDILFFNTHEYSFIYQYKFSSNTNYSFNNDNDIVYIGPQSSIILRNNRHNSIIVNMKNITGNLDQYDFEEYLDYTEFKNLIAYIENNIQNTYDKKLSKMINLLFKLISTRRNEVVVP